MDFFSVVRRYRPRAHRPFFVVILLVIFLPASPAAHAEDPVERFIIESDSIARSSGGKALAFYVKTYSILTGAAVNQLLDVAITVGDEGRKSDEEENIDFARLLSKIYLEKTGSRILLQQVEQYAGWNPAQRLLRKKAGKLEEEAVAARSARDFDKAHKFYDEARAIYIDIGDLYSTAVQWGSLGVLCWHAGDFNSVLKNYETALEARRSIENRILEGRTLNGLGTANYVLEKYGTAADYYQQAIDLRRKTNDLAGLGTSLTYMGNTLFEMGFLLKARNSFEEALAIIEKVGSPVQRFELLNSIASLYSDMGQMKRSNKIFHEALQIVVAEQDAVNEIICRMNIALNLGNTFHLNEAMNQLDIAQQLLINNPDPLQMIHIHKNRGVIFLAMGEMDNARDSFLSFLKESRRHEAPGLEMEALIKLGYLFWELGALDEALDFADSSRAAAERNQDGGIYREAHMLAAQLERVRGNYDKSMTHWQEALDQDRYEQAESRILEDEIGIANVTAYQGKSEEARKQYHSLKPRVIASGREDLLLPINLGLAHSFENEDPDSARHYYGQALEITENMRSEIGRAESGSGFFSSNYRYIYEEIARYYSKMSRNPGGEEWSSEAFRTIEKAKARGLLDLMQNSVVSDHSAEEEAVLDSIYSLDPSAPSDAARLQQFESRYRLIRDQRLKRTTGRLETIDYLPGLKEISAKLPKKTAMLSYALGDSVSLLWVIDRSGAELFELPPRSELALDAEILKDAVVCPGSGDAILRSAARRLYLSLIQPARIRLAKKRYLMIVPDGCLFEIPFELLLTDDPGKEDGWGELPYLARSYSTVYLPSASIYLKLRTAEKKKKFDLDIIALGDPDYSGSASRGKEELTPLPFSRTEIEKISSYFKDKRKLVLLGDEASEAALKAAIRSQSPRFIHIAAHGLVDPAEPIASSLALAPGPDDSEDGFLHTLEILSQPLHSRLVVLSACESARGRLGRGEGVVGLSRAFIGAGAQGVVSSLWAVSDESTSHLMNEFYRIMINEKKSAREALNKARMKLMKDPDFAHPFYWSAFIVTGTERSPW